MKEKAKRKPAQTLMQAFNFTEQDLEANHEGWLSDEQREQLRLDQARYNVRLRRAMLVASIIIFGLAVLVGRMVGDEVINWPFAIMSLCFAVLYYQWKRGTYNKKCDEDLEENTVASVEGWVQLDVSVEGPTYKLTIQDMSFTVSKDIFLALKNGEPYIIYYLPHTKKLLSAEWLREA